MDVTSVRFAFTLISSVAAFMGASACFMDFILLFIFLQVFFSSSKSLLFAWNTSRVVCCLCAIYLFRLCCCCFFSHALSIFFCCCITFCLNVSLSLLILLSLPLTVAPNAVDAFHCFCIIVYLWFLFYSIHSCFDIIFVCHFILLSLCCWCVYNFSLFHNGKILLRIIELLRGIVRLNPIGKYVSTVKNHAFAGAIFIFPVWMMGSQVGASIAYTLN